MNIKGKENKSRECMKHTPKTSYLNKNTNKCVSGAQQATIEVVDEAKEKTP